MYDVIILGSGPAGLTAALYCARAGKKTLVLGGETLGGQLATIATIENYPGWTGSGYELAIFMHKQALSFGAEIHMETVKNIININNEFRIISTTDKEYSSSSIIIATGASPKKLDISGARELFGHGISYCATCDGFFYQGKNVLVIGGGNTALTDALYLADLAKNVKIIYRKSDFFRAENILRQRISEHPNIECLYNTELTEVKVLDDSNDSKLIANTNTNIELICDGIFVAIGHEANTDFLSETIKRDDMGRLSQDNLPQGMFVAGDICSKLQMQVATAVGTGCSSAMNAIAYINSLK